MKEKSGFALHVIFFFFLFVMSSLLCLSWPLCMETSHASFGLIHGTAVASCQRNKNYNWRALGCLIPLEQPVPALQDPQQTSMGH